MYNLRFLRAATGACAMSLLLAASAARAEWMVFTGGPTVSNGAWPGTASYGGGAIATASNFVNGNNATPFIGISPNTVPNLSSDYFATGLTPNFPPANVSAISTPYNDNADTYHVVIDFSGTFSGAGAGFLPAGSTIAIIDLDIQEDYRNIKATNPANVAIAAPWLAPPSTWFDMNLPMIPVGSLGAPPTFTPGPPGVYDMFGISWNFDAGFWQFQTTQNVRTISFDMSKSSSGNQIGGGGAGWAFYAPRGPIVPEPSVLLLLGIGAVGLVSARRRLM